MTALDRIAPYVEQVFENDNVQRNLERSVTRARQAYAGARGKKDAKKAIKDRRVRSRVKESVAAARNAAVAIRRGPELQQRARRRRRLLVVMVIAGAGSLAASEKVRTQIAGWLGDVADSSSESQSSPEPGGTSEANTGSHPMADAESSSISSSEEGERG